MDDRASFGRGRDNDRGRTNDPSEYPTSPPSRPPLPLPLQLDHRQGSQASALTPLPPLPESPLTTTTPIVSTPRASTFRPSTTSAPSAQSTIRTVTPEPLDQRRIPHDSVDAGDPQLSSTSHAGRAFGSVSPQSSPRTIPGASGLSHHSSTSSRRQGVVFSDAIAGSFDSTSSSPPPRPPVFRPRTHTMDGASPFREPNTVSEPRTRVSSFSSSGTGDSSSRLASSLQGTPLESLGYPLIAPNRSSEAQVTTVAATPTAGPVTASSSAASIASLGAGGGAASPTVATSTSREKKGSSRRLIKRTSSRPTSPLVSPPPSVDSLPLPIPTADANKVLMLMKTLCGRMRGEIEYRTNPDGTWSGGISYIEEEKGSLMFDAGEHGSFHTAIVPDLRGCRVLPLEQPDKDSQCLELINAQATIEIVFRPLIAAEFDLWLAALLCWQQLRQAPGVVFTPNAKLPSSRSVSTPASEPNKKRASGMKTKEGTIIKVGKVMLWDKGVATSPRAIVKRPSTRDLKSIQTSWRRVSCILQGNGEFKLMTENDVTILSVIELTQLARCAIQQLDKSVLDEEYCIAIFPTYALTSTQLSIFRPVYIALDSRVAFEVWLVLLRAFAVPDIYALDPTNDSQAYEVTDMHSEPEDEHVKPQSPDELPLELEDHPSGEPVRRQLFRLEKSLNLRVTEAKIKPRTPGDSGHGFHDRPHERSYERSHERPGKNDHHDPLVGNYLAEVILDGEVRARTTTKTDTKNPFWREDCEFGDMPPALPFLSVVLKRVDGNLDSFTHQLQASLGLPKTGNLREVMFGSVDIPLSNLERGKDHEQWLPICDNQQQTVGSMLIKVHLEELAVLAANEYKPILEMLHKFSSGLTLQIAEVMPGSLRRLAEVFLNIFQVSGAAGDWLMALVEDEIDGIGNQTSMKKMRFSRRLKSNESVESASDREQIVRDMGRSLQGEANLLFRGNSLLTQALEFHMRRLGKEYLEEVLSDKIFEINEINPDCEVDPSKVHPGDDLHKHWDQLMMFTNEVWECIMTSAPQFPPELRHILKYIRAVAEDRYGDFLRTVAYTSVSGFLFLRFVCPAILNPKLFGLLRDHPRPRAQRTLTLIAKGLQALANLSTIGRKETWMEPMNRFLAAQRQSVKDFIDSICSIPAEKPNAPPMLPASYSTPLTIMSRLSTAAREGSPSLPYLIDQPRNIAALVKLWIDAHPLSSPAHVYDGELLEFNAECLRLQAKSDECFARAESLRHITNADASQLATDETLAEAVEKASLTDSINVSYGNVPAWMEGAEGGSASSNSMTAVFGNRSGGLVPPGSSGSEMEDHWGRDGKAHQMGIGGSGNGQSEAGGSMKMLRNGKHARKFLSGIINRKPRTASPDHIVASSPAGTLRHRDRDKEREKEPDHDRDHRDAEEERDQEGVRGRDHRRDRDGGHDHKRTLSKDKRDKRDKSATLDKPDKSDKASKNDKPDKGRGFNLGEAWSTSSMTAADVLMRHNYHS